MEEKQEVLLFLVANEYTTKQISLTTGVNVRTVKRELTKMYIKYKVQGRVGLVKKFYEKELEDERRQKSA